MGQFAAGTFTGTDGTTLSTHDAAWTIHPSYTGTVQIAANRLRPSSTTLTSAYTHSGTPASADYSVSADLFAKTTDAGDGGSGVIGRASTSVNTFYHARYVGAAIDGWQLYKFLAGAATQLGSTSAQSLTDETSYNIKLEMIGTAIKLYKEGSATALITPPPDGDITAAGKSGIRIITGAGLNSDTAGLHLDNFSADDVASSVAYALTCNAGSYVYTGQSAALTVKRSLSCASGSYAYTGISASLSVKHSIFCASGSYSYSGVAATLSVKHGLSCDAGAYTYAGIATTLTYIPGDGTVDYVLACAVGAYAYSGQAAALSVKHNLTCAAGSYSYSGVSASLRVAHGLTCSAGSYIFTGQAAALSVSRNLACTTGTYDYIGNTASLSYLSGIATIEYTLSCAGGAYAYTGQSATLLVVASSTWAGDTVRFTSAIRQQVNFTSAI